jgi:hypothetical protein
MHEVDADRAEFGAEPADDVDVLGREVLEADVDVVVLDEAGDAALPLPVKVNSHVRFGVEVADVAGSAAVLGDDPQHRVRLACDADDGSARATGTPTGGLEHGVMAQQA